MSNEIVVCEKCGETMIGWQKDGACGMECPKCGWGWATTYQSEMDIDQTNYTVFLEPGNDVTKDNIKTIAAICHVNYLSAKKLLLEVYDVPVYVAKDEAVSEYSKAEKVRQVASLLRASGLRYHISPDFPYTV